MTRLDEILALADRGWPVFPCRTGEKNPATEHGFKDATRDRAQIEEWFGNGSNFNVAVPTGAETGIWAVDVDKKNGGLESLKRLQKEYGTLPPTLRQATPSGGGHIFFRWPEDFEIRNKVSIAPGIDVRGEG